MSGNKYNKLVLADETVIELSDGEVRALRKTLNAGETHQLVKKVGDRVINIYFQGYTFYADDWEGDIGNGPIPEAMRGLVPQR